MRSTELHVKFIISYIVKVHLYALQRQFFCNRTDSIKTLLPSQCFQKISQIWATMKMCDYVIYLGLLLKLSYPNNNIQMLHFT